MVVQSENGPKACISGPIIGLMDIEGGASLYAVLEEVDKDPKPDIAAKIGLAEDIEFGMYANCGDVALVYLVAVARGKSRRRSVGRLRRGVESGTQGVIGDLRNGGRVGLDHSIGIAELG